MAKSKSKSRSVQNIPSDAKSVRSAGQVLGHQTSARKKTTSQINGERGGRPKGRRSR